jgi:hypothetical protein
MNLTVGNAPDVNRSEVIGIPHDECQVPAVVRPVVAAQAPAGVFRDLRNFPVVQRVSTYNFPSLSENASRLPSGAHSGAYSIA